jgi:hypothetical protein
MEVNVAYEIFLSYFERFFNMPQTLATSGRRLYFPFEGRRSLDFIALKIHRCRPGSNPRTLGPMASTLPLDHRGRLNTGLVCDNPDDCKDSPKYGTVPWCVPENPLTRLSSCGSSRLQHKPVVFPVLLSASPLYRCVSGFGADRRLNGNLSNLAQVYIYEPGRSARGFSFLSPLSSRWLVGPFGYRWLFTTEKMAGA